MALHLKVNLSAFCSWYHVFTAPTGIADEVTKNRIKYFGIHVPEDEINTTFAEMK